jgi:hypothetical protein
MESITTTQQTTKKSKNGQEMGLSILTFWFNAFGIDSVLLGEHGALPRVALEGWNHSSWCRILVVMWICHLLSAFALSSLRFVKARTVDGSFHINVGIALQKCLLPRPVDKTHWVPETNNHDKA